MRPRRIDRALAIAALLPLMVFGLLPRTVGAHEAVDPVCGMSVSTDDARWTAEHAGKTYYFCMAADRDAFVAAPEKYVAVLRVEPLVGDERVDLVVTPLVPVEGDVVRFTLEVKGLEVASARALLYDVDRSAETRAREVVLHRLPDETLAFQRVLGRRGEWRVIVDVDGVDGSRLRTLFAVPVAMPPAPARAGPGGALSMTEQHDAMRRIGDHWAAAGRGLTGARPDLGAVASHLGAVREDAALVPRFSLHRFFEAKAEFKALALEFRARVRALEELSAESDVERVRSEYRRTDLESCTRCHLKFRWGLVEDLSRFPEVRR